MESEHVLNTVSNDFISDDDPLFVNFIEIHKAQLESNRIPENFWKSLFIKLKCEIFDAGSVFSMFQIQYEEVTSDYLPQKVFVSSDDPVDPGNKDHIFLIDHAWTYKAPEAKVYLCEVPGLLNRMAKLMGKSVQSVTILDDIINTMWKYNLTYSYSFGTNIEDRLPLWYIMDEFGSAIQHSDSPNVKLVPFVFLPEGITYSLLYPLRKIYKDEEVTRDFAEGYVDVDIRRAALIPWRPSDLKNISYIQEEPSEEYFQSERIIESLPNLSLLLPKESNGNCNISSKTLWKVHSDYSFINQYLTHPKFQCVQDQNDADILWLTTPFKEYLEFSETNPQKFINQFPCEHVIITKDLLSIVCRRISGNKENCNLSTLDTLPSWLPTTYNLNNELCKFVSYFQHRESKGLDNYWICKPWNLARSLDTHITNNLDYIIRIASSGPKIAQKYISRPVLFDRPDCGLVKFDIRYVILLKSVSPLEVYAYKNFFLRFANKPFALRDFEDYEKHFTVMNYNKDAPLCKMLCNDFIKEFNEQNNSTKWESVEKNIFSMLRKVFEAATMKKPPCGIGNSPQSRALYAADIMLSIDQESIYTPKLLEINWAPDCQRACEYYPNFYNDIFSLLFLDESKDIFEDLNNY